MEFQSLPSVVVDGDREVSAGELSADVLRVAAGLRDRGVGPGDRVVVSLANSYEFVAVHLALDALGAVTVNLPAGFRREVGQVVRMVDAVLCVMGLVEDTRVYGDLRQVVSVADGLDALSGDPSGLALAPRAEGERAWLAFTSGSTGTPRAAVHTRRSLAASTRAMAERYGVGPDDSVLVAAPVGHAIGFCYGVRLACDVGSRMVLQRSWSADRAISLIDEQGCTFAAVPAPFLADLVDAGARPAGGTLRHLLVGGAPVPRDQLVEADALFGPGVVSRYFGASECGAVLSCPPGAPDAKRLSSDGVVMGGLEVRVVDEAGLDVAVGVEGEMLVRGEQVALGYWASNDSDEQFGADGWFATRDRVAADEAGYVSVTGRLKDLVISGAVNVVPREVEEAVASHPAVGHVIVFGRPDRRMGERVVAAFTTVGEPPDLEAIREWLASSGLARAKWPAEVVVIDELPRTGSGKIDRERVRAELLDGELTS